MASQPPPLNPIQLDPSQLDPNQPGSYCQGCRAYGPTKYVRFYQHIGAILMMFNRHIKGRLCRNCVNEYFARMSLVTTFFGWWGMISFFLTPFFLLNNAIRYLFCLALKPGPGVPERGTGLAILALCLIFVFPVLALALFINLAHK